MIECCLVTLPSNIYETKFGKKANIKNSNFWKKVQQNDKISSLYSNTQCLTKINYLTSVSM